MSDYYLICTGCGHKDEAPFDVCDVCPWCDNGNLVDEYSYSAGRQLGRKEGMRHIANDLSRNGIYVSDPLLKGYKTDRRIGNAVLTAIIEHIRKAAGETE